MQEIIFKFSLLLYYSQYLSKDSVNNITWLRSKFDKDVFFLLSNFTLLTLHEEDFH